MSDSFVRDALAFCEQKTRQYLALGGYPSLTEAGRWRTTAGRTSEGHMPADFGWTAGFLPGLLWLCVLEQRDERLASVALDLTLALAPRAHDDTTHDLGFLFFPSFVRGYEISGDARLRDAAVEAAHTLRLRFNEAGGFLRAWGKVDDPHLRGHTTIDAMMNLGLLFWAAQESGDSDLSRVALAHALTTSRTLVRPDGSTFHVYEFDPDSGRPIRGYTHQGYADDSCWARGQAWAIYGFAAAYRWTRLPALQAVAMRTADFFIASLPQDGVPSWDFRAPDGPSAPRDTSAAAASASGLLLLGRLCDGLDGERYLEAGERIARSLWERYSSRNTPNWEGMLLQGVMHMRAGRGVGESLIFGDFYFAEALGRLAGVVS